MTNNDNLLQLRLNDQKIACESLFSRIHFTSHEPELRLDINCYHINLDDSGTPRAKELAKYLAEMLTQYVHSLSDVVDAQNNPRDFQRLSLDAARFLARKKQGELGEFILWMLLEGIVGVPKVLTKHPLKTNTNMQNFGSDGVHAGIDQDNKLVIYIGESKLKKTITSSMDDAINSLLDHMNVKTGKIALDQDIYLLDHHAAKDITDPNLARMLKDFAKPGSLTRGSAYYQLSVFTGYDSKVISQLNQQHHTQVHDFLKSNYLKEVKRISDQIYKKVAVSNVKSLRVVWFVLPFDTIQDFEDAFIAAVRGEY